MEEKSQDPLSIQGNNDPVDFGPKYCDSKEKKEGLLKNNWEVWDPSNNINVKENIENQMKFLSNFEICDELETPIIIPTALSNLLYYAIRDFNSNPNSKNLGLILLNSDVNNEPVKVHLGYGTNGKMYIQEIIESIIAMKNLGFCIKPDKATIFTADGKKNYLKNLILNAISTFNLSKPLLSVDGVLRQKSHKSNVQYTINQRSIIIKKALETILSSYPDLESIKTVGSKVRNALGGSRTIKNYKKRKNISKKCK